MQEIAKKRQIHQINRIPGNYSYVKEEVFTDRKAAEAWLDWISQKIHGP